MTVVVNTHSEQEEKVLLAFLDSLQYDYQKSGNDDLLTDEQKREIERRYKSYLNGETEAYDWEDVKREFGDLYR